MLSYLRQPRSFYKELTFLTLPMVGQNLVTAALGFIDIFMVGLLGSAEMSAVTVANVPILIVQLACFGLQSGSGVLISQYWGKRDIVSINRVLGVGLYAAGGLSCLFALIFLLVPDKILWLVTDNTELIALAAPYLEIVGISYIFNSITSIYIGVQCNTENTKVGMYILGVSMCFNTVGNYILIFGKLGFPALGIRGAAIATCASRVLELLVTAGYIAVSRRIPLMPRYIFSPGLAMAKKFAYYSYPIMLNEALWSLGTSVVTSIMGHMPSSEDILSAYTLSGNINNLLTVALYGVAGASEVVIGKEIGMGKQESAYQKGWALAFVAFGVGIAIMVLFLLAYPLIIVPYILPLFHLTEKALRICSGFILFYALSAPFHSFVSSTVLGTLRGGGDVRASFLIDILPLWLVSIPVMALVGLVLPINPVFFCATIMIEWVCKTPLGLHRLRSGKWIHDITQN